MELVFPETHQNKINASKNMKQNVMSRVDQQKPSEPFVPAGPLMSQRLKSAIDKRNSIAKNKDKLQQIMHKTLSQNDRDYFEEMKEIKKKLSVDDNYCKKFGLLKKASVLTYYGRDNEAFNEIAKAVVIIKD